jgi:FixJ family two-component response regulator
LDVKFQRMRGIEPEKKLKEIDPDMRLIFMTGHGSDDDFRSGPAGVGAEYYLI